MYIHMSANTYTYSITRDFKSLVGTLDGVQLQKATTLWLPTNASTVSLNGDVVTINFATALISSDVTILTQSINSYQNVYASTYIYSIAGDFHALTEVLDQGQFQQALILWFPANSLYINTNGDQLSIIFTTPLSSTQQTTLTNNIYSYLNVYLSYVIGNYPDEQVVMYHKLSSGAYEGSSVGGTWVPRALNVVDGNVSAWLTLNTTTNTFILKPGKYLLTAFVPAYQVGRHQARLYNATLGQTQNLGTSAFDSQLSEIHSLWINNRPDEFRIDHFCSNTVANVGLGIPLNDANGTPVSSFEIYTIVRIDKLF